MNFINYNLVNNIMEYLKAVPLLFSTVHLKIIAADFFLQNCFLNLANRKYM